jgi:hypothetical protein
MRERRASSWFEWLLLAVATACSHPDKTQAKPLLGARRASRFVCQGTTCRQDHPRLPDTGEWRCAERDGVVWCAGGEAAAGVVAGRADPAFQCGPRWGHEPERVCIARHPDYPDGGGESYRCSYDQEHGIARTCRLAKSVATTALLERALPACWLDSDCGSQACDRGACRCQNDTACLRGRCRGGVCAGDEP